MKNMAPMDAAALEALETREWLESLDYVLHQGDAARTVRLLEALRARARVSGVRVPFVATTPYINTISAQEQVAMPGDGSRAHLPAPSYWPLVLALGLPLIGYGLIFNLVLAAIGGATVLAGFVGWALEPPDDEDLPPHGPAEHAEEVASHD